VNDRVGAALAAAMQMWCVDRDRRRLRLTLLGVLVDLA
jgi:hypothetical protein